MAIRTDTTESREVDVSRLEHFPVTFFASVMGLAGLTLALHRAEAVLGAGHAVSSTALAVTVAVFMTITVVYAVKALRLPQAVAAEWRHPVKLAFFPTVSISLLLIATALRPEAEQAARAIWLAGTVLQGVLTLAVVAGWIGHRPFEPVHISPAWFIPAVGNVVVPVAGAPLGYVELSWLFFSAGIVFWLILLTLVMNRLIFHDPLPARLYPTLVILIAPPSVAFLAWMQLTGDLTPFARVLFYTAIVFAGIVATQAGAIARLPFALSWWALSFPVAALTLAAFTYSDAAGVPGVTALAFALLALLVVIVVYLALRTLGAIRSGAICRPE